MTVLLAVPALMNVQLAQFPKVMFTKLIPKHAQIVGHVLMYALLKQFILHSHPAKVNETVAIMRRFFFSE